MIAGRRFDLHLHTDRSDGHYPPADVIGRALAGGLDVLAVTDHDLYGSVPPGEHREGDRRLHVIAAAELSGMHAGHEFHLLAYFRDEPPARFLDFCDAQIRERARRYDTAVARLSAAFPAMTLPPASADAHAGRRALTRHHLADALVTAGVASSRREAFDRWVGGDTFVPAFEVAYLDVIAFAVDCGAVTSWAHPPPATLAYTPAFAKAGLRALEMFRPAVTGPVRRLYRKAAKAHGLFATGGSDWHGTRWDGALGSFWVERADLAGFTEAIGA